MRVGDATGESGTESVGELGSRLRQRGTELTRSGLATLDVTEFGPRDVRGGRAVGTWE